MGESGIRVVEKILPEFKQKLQIDVVIGQAENVSGGKGLSLTDFDRLKSAGIDAFSGGDHTIDRAEIFPLLEDPHQPVIGPANMRECPGPGYKYVTANGNRVLFVSLLGNVVGRYAYREIDNPLETIDSILKNERSEKTDAVVVNFHGDYSSETRHRLLPRRPGDRGHRRSLARADGRRRGITRRNRPYNRRRYVRIA